MRVQALTSGRLAASSRFRIGQHVAPLAALGITVRDRPPRVSKYAAVPPSWQRMGPVAPAALSTVKLASRLPAVARSWAADLTWLEREILPGRRTLEPLLHRPLLFDVDDAIWLFSDAQRDAVAWTARRAACVVAGNDYLAEWFEGAGATVARVWTAIDTDRFRPRPCPPPAQDDGGFVVGWTGSRSALRYLAALAEPLRRFLDAEPRATLLVVCDAEPWLPGVPASRIRFERWSEDREASLVQAMDVGLAPLPDSPWARGKCGFKMLQYMASGLPVVAAPVGMNAQLLDLAEVGLAAADDAGWFDALRALREDPALRGRLGDSGRALALAQFSIPVISRQLAEVMRRHA
jgi:glycosyltransferase involved in cell wall biosynthesis